MRAERFLAVARHDTIGAAANAIGVSAGVLSVQMRRISADAGGPLIARAQKGLPLSLTDLGAEVRHELMGAFGLSEAEDPALPGEGCL